MRIYARTASVLLALPMMASVASACAVDATDDLDTGLSDSMTASTSATATTGATTGDSGDASSDTSPTSATTGASDTQAETTAAGSCDFNVTAAIKLEVDVSWSGGIAVTEGSGQVEVWILGELDHDGTNIGVTGRVCRIALPDFETGVLAGFEKYGTEFPDSIWSTPGIPEVDAIATVSTADPGAALHLERGAVILGASLADPLNNPWPGSWQQVASEDHDADGSPGMTALAKAGSGYSNPRLDPFDQNSRAEALFIASRSILELSGTIDSCESASGTTMFSMENHAVGCKVAGGGNCTPEQTTTLDGNMPQFTVSGGAFDLLAIDDDADCGAVITALP